MPRTLFARLFILLALAMTASAIALTALFTLSEQAPRARQMAQLLSSIANLTRAAVVAAAPERRIDLLNDLSSQEGIRIYVAEENEAEVPPLTDPLMLEVQQQLIVNLVVNAAEAVDPQNGLIAMRTGSRDLGLADCARIAALAGCGAS